jgi:membrane associated rhomboid family serine protease
LLERYDTINWAARYFAIGFATQAALLVWTGVIRNRLRFAISDLQTPLIPAKAGIQSPKRQPAISQNWIPAFAGTSGAGMALFLYALVLHPLIAPLTGRPWTQAEIFGLAPDPTAVATLGMLLTAGRPLWLLFVIPVLWCVLTGLTLWTMESAEAPVAPIAAAIAAMIAAWKGRSRSRKWPTT